MKTSLARRAGSAFAFLLAVGFSCPSLAAPRATVADPPEAPSIARYSETQIQHGGPQLGIARAATGNEGAICTVGAYHGNTQALIDIMHQALWISLLLAGPTLGLALIVLGAVFGYELAEGAVNTHFAIYGTYLSSLIWMLVGLWLSACDETVRAPDPQPRASEP